MTRLKRVVLMRAGGTPSVDDPEMWSDKGVPWVTISDMTKSRVVTETERRLSAEGIQAKRLPIGNPGTVLFAMYASVGALGELGCVASWNQAILGVEPVPGLADSRFISYWLENLRSDLGALARSNTQDNLNAEQVGNFPFPTLDIGRQRSIADYLDAETARIDALIAKKRRLIELLAEQAWAWALRLVLGDDGERGGLPSPSGLYRLLPHGWSETALRHLGCNVQTGPFGSQLHAEEYVESEWPVVNPMNIVGGEIVQVDSMTINDAKRQELSRHILRTGDIVFARRGEMGRAGLVAPEHEGWICGTGSLRLRLNGKYLVADYLKLLLGTPPAKAYFELSSVGSTMDNLNSDIVLGLPTLAPPPEEQHGIVAAVAERRKLTNTTTERLSQQIGLLVEHRKALITAAVTGELEVPGVAA